MTEQESRRNAPEIAPLRFVERCPECGYSLNGLPDEGVCPECGVAYDQRVIILHGAAMGSQATLANATRGRAVWILLLSVLQTWGIWSNLSRPGDVRVLVWVVALAWIIFLLSMLLARWGNDRPGLIRVYLSPTGCLQVNQTSRGTWRPLYGMAVGLLVAVFIWYLVTSLISEIGAFLTAAVCLLLAALIGVGIYLRLRGEPKVRGRQPAPEEELVKKGTAWKEVGEILFAPSRADHLRIRLRLRPQRWSYTTDAVDAEVECVFARAKWIEKLIRSWAGTAPTNNSTNRE